MASNLGITISAGVRTNLLALQRTASQTETVNNRLATGKKVNSALDNPTNFFTASALSSRANDLSNLLDNMANGIKTIQAADNGITSMTKTIESMQATVRQARQDKSFQAKSYEIDTAAIGTTTQKSISFSGGAVGAAPISINLNTLQSAGTVAATSTSTAYAAPAAGVKANASTSAAFTGTTAASGPVTAGGAFTALDVSNGDETYSFTVSRNGGAAVNIQLTDADAAGTTITFNEAITAINGQLSTASSSIRARDDGAGQIEFYDTDTTNTGSTSSIAVSAVTTAGTAPAGSLGFDAAGVTGTGTDGTSLQFSVNGLNVNVTGTHDFAGTLASINSQLNGSAFEAWNDSGKIGIREKEANGGTITIGGANAALFAAPTAGTAGGSYDLTVNGKSVKLTDAESSIGLAVTKANADLGADNNVEAFNDGGKLGFREKAAKGGTISIGGNSATALFGGPNPTVTGTAATTAGVKTVDQLVEEINGTVGLKGAIRASNDNGKLRIENLSTTDLTVGGSSSGGTKLNGSTETNTVGKNDVRAKLVDEFKKLRDQLDKYADDASFNGINLLRGDRLKLTLNESGTSALDIRTDNETGINNLTLGIQDATVEEFGSDTDLDARLEQLSKSLVNLRSQASAFGTNLSVVQNRQDFTKTMINTLQTGADNLTLADSNEEGANLMALQTRSQLSTTALSFAVQADQTVLSFLR